MEAGRTESLDRAWELPADRLERRMAELHPPLGPRQALAEANRCLYCHDAPCIAACPTRIDIPEFIRRIATGNLAGAARTILEANILGLSCARVCPTEVLCAGACVYNHLDQPPIDIGGLQRYATEHVYERGLQLFRAAPPNGRRVACVGGGPASLACAHELALLGYRVTILEARALPGGLNTTGVAPYKLYAEDSLREVAYILEAGNIELRAGCAVGPEQLAELEQHYDAIFIGVGLGSDSPLAVPGAEAEGVIGAVDLIERIKNRPAAELAWLGELGEVVVVGGGNTSIDVVRELRRLGVPNVTLVYRRAERFMSAYRHEVEGARREGAVLLFERAPVRVVRDQQGRARGLEVRRTRTVELPEGGRRLELLPGTEHVLPADLIVVAIGQQRLGELFAGIQGIRIEGGRLVCDPVTGQTGNPKYFAGGDCANGGREVVDAAAEGKRAARGIHAWLERAR